MKYIKIPVPEKRDWKRWGEIILFKLRGGFRCKHCGAKMQFKRFQLDTKISGKRLMFKNNTDCICPACVIKELVEKKDVVFTEKESKCDWCGDIKDTTSFPRDKSLECNVHFGSMWWNGHHICQHCVEDIAIEPYTESSSILKQEGDRMYPVNEIGLTVKKK